MSSDDFPFQTVGEALRFYHQNPARARFPNIFELDRKSKPYHPEFHPRHPEMLWAAIVKAVNTALAGQRNEARQAWAMCNFGDRTKRYHPQDAAKKLGIRRSTLYRWLKRINEDIEAQLISRELIPPRDNETH